jgi:hypothetical protein
LRSTQRLDERRFTGRWNVLTKIIAAAGKVARRDFAGGPGL